MLGIAPVTAGLKVGAVVGATMPCLPLIPMIGCVSESSPPGGTTTSLPSVGVLRTIAWSSAMPAPDPGRKNASRMNGSSGLHLHHNVRRLERCSAVGGTAAEGPDLSPPPDSGSPEYEKGEKHGVHDRSSISHVALQVRRWFSIVAVVVCACVRVCVCTCVGGGGQ